MHLMIPFAAPLSPAGMGVLNTLALPQLQALLAAWQPQGRDEGSEWTLSPPHERAMARAWGWRGGDGCLPFAARAAAADGVDTGDLAWGLLTPTHWHLGTEQVSLLDPDGLMLDEGTSRALFSAVQELFTSEGFLLAWGAPSRWYLAHSSLAERPCASLDRVVGRNLDRWMGGDVGARQVRRLQSEVQMLLYGHALNEARESRGLLPVNSFWLSGCGATQAAAGTTAGVPALQVDNRLRSAALANDWAAWTQAWQTLDEGPIRALRAAAAQGHGARLTLCGERASASFAPRPAGAAGSARRLLSRLRSLGATPPVQPLLESL